MDAATGLAALIGGVAALCPSRSTSGDEVTVIGSTRGNETRRNIATPQLAAVTTTKPSVRVVAFAISALSGAAAAVGWSSTLSSSSSSAPGAPQNHHSLTHMWWLPGIAALAPALCAYSYWTLESTVADARKLRGLKYAHKRA